MTTLQNLVANSGTVVQIGENFDAVSAAGIYGRRAPAIVGLTWAYYGGRGFGNTVADGTVALTASTTSYVVASRSTGAISVSTGLTNWNDTTNYFRCYLIVTGAASITTATDYREFTGGAPSGGFTGGTLTSALNEAPPATIASAGTMNIGAAAANSISVTGTTTVTAFDTIAAGAKRELVFAGVLTLTHNATSMILPTGANITTAAGDVADFVSLGSGNWRCVNYMRANGQALSAPGGGFTGGTLTSALNEAPQVALASASTVNIGAAAANTVTVSGTTTITAFDTIAAGAIRRVRFLAALTLTHNATSLILPGSANIATAAGDVATMESLGSGNWRCIDYAKADGTAVVGGGGGVTGFTTSLATSSPNNVTNSSVLLASGGTSNQHIVIQAKGNGSIVAQLPDGTAAGGNTRGTNGVDFQTLCNAATQVASGANSAILCGNRNTANGDGVAILNGFNNTATGTNSVVGGQSCSTGGSATGAVAMGSAASATGVAAIALGTSVTASGANAVALGTTGSAVGDASTSIGDGANARTRGSMAHASGQIATSGDCQVERLVHRRVTTNATPAPLSAANAAPAATTAAVLPNNSVFAFEVTVVGKVSTFGDRGSWKISGQIARGANAAVTVIDGTPTSTTIATVGGASGWVAAVSANTTLGSLEVTVTGAAATTILWVARIELTEVVG